MGFKAQKCDAYLREIAAPSVSLRSYNFVSAKERRRRDIKSGPSNMPFRGIALGGTLCWRCCLQELRLIARDSQRLQLNVLSAISLRIDNALTSISTAANGKGNFGGGDNGN